MTKELQTKLNKMGKGWFILKISEDKGVNTLNPSEYGKETAMKARLQRYEATKKYHKEMLEYLLNNWSNRISAGMPVLSNSTLKDYALKTLRLL